MADALYLYFSMMSKMSLFNEWGISLQNMRSLKKKVKGDFKGRHKSLSVLVCISGINFMILSIFNGIF